MWWLIFALTAKTIELLVPFFDIREWGLFLMASHFRLRHATEYIMKTTYQLCYVMTRLWPDLECDFWLTAVKVLPWMSNCFPLFVLLWFLRHALTLDDGVCSHFWSMMSFDNTYLQQIEYDSFSLHNYTSCELWIFVPWCNTQHILHI